MLAWVQFNIISFFFSSWKDNFRVFFFWSDNLSKSSVFHIVQDFSKAQVLYKYSLLEVV